MPLFMCRWVNGDCFFVRAPSKDVAIEYLDEIGNADGSLLTVMRDLMEHFELTSDGKLKFHSFGEAAERGIYEKAYPVLDDLLPSDRLSGRDEPTPRDLALIRAAVAKEEKRLEGKKARRLPQTEAGQKLAKEMGAPARMVDRMVLQVAGEKLKSFRPKGKPH